MNDIYAERELDLEAPDVDLSVVLAVLREWQSANRLASEVQASMAPAALDVIRAAGVQSREDIAARWVAAVAGLHPEVVATYAGLLDYVVGVVEAIADHRTPEPPTERPACSDRVAELEARVEELETLIAGAGAVLREASV